MDIMTGYRAFSYLFVKTFPVLSQGFEIETEMSIHAVDKNMHVANVVVEYRDRPSGSVSKLNTFSDGLRVLKTILLLYVNYKPLHFFSTLALILGVLGTAFLLPVLHVYIRTGTVGRFPTLFVCGMVLLAAIMSFFTGLIVSNMHNKDRRDFEKSLIYAENEYRRKQKD